MKDPETKLNQPAVDSFPIKYTPARFEVAAALKAAAEEIGPAVTLQFFRLKDENQAKVFTRNYLSSVLPKDTSPEEYEKELNRYTEDFSSRLGADGNEVAVVMLGPDISTLEDLMGAAINAAIETQLTTQSLKGGYNHFN